MTIRFLATGNSQVSLNILEREEEVTYMLSRFHSHSTFDLDVQLFAAL